MLYIDEVLCGLICWSAGSVMHVVQWTCGAFIVHDWLEDTSTASTLISICEGHLHRGWICAPKLCHKKMCSFAYLHTATSPFFLYFFFFFWNSRLGLKCIRVNLIGIVGGLLHIFVYKNMLGAVKLCYCKDWRQKFTNIVLKWCENGIVMNN